MKVTPISLSAAGIITFYLILNHTHWDPIKFKPEPCCVQIKFFRIIIPSHDSFTGMRISLLGLTICELWFEWVNEIKREFAIRREGRHRELVNKNICSPIQISFLFLLLCLLRRINYLNQLSNRFIQIEWCI